jgi:methyl-accepting chemotaxis protein
MAPRLADIRISTKIAIASLVPLAGLTLFVGLAVWNAWSDAVSARAVLSATGLAESASLAIHELQKERGMSAGFVASKGQRFAAELALQRQSADDRTRSFLNAASNFRIGISNGATASALDKATNELKKIDPLRKSVTGLSVPAGESTAAYTQIIASLLSVAEGISELSGNAELTQAAAIYTATIRGKEQAGQERANGARGFSADRFSSDDLRTFLSLAAAQNEQFDIVRRTAKPAQHDALATALSTPAGKEVSAMRNAALKIAVGESADRISATNWFNAATARIDDLKKVEDRFAENLRETAGATSAEAMLKLSVTLAGAISLIVLAAGITWLSARSITGPLTRLVRTTLTLAEGKTEIDISDADRKDEIGDLSRAIAVFRDNAIERGRLEEAAHGARLQREERQRRIDALIERFRGAVGQTLGEVGENTALMDNTAKTLSSIADGASGQAAGALSASEEASANVQSVAAATEQLSASIQEIGQQVERTSTISRRAVEMANLSNSEVEALSSAAQRIGDVIDIIQAIAAQTNLLALNATIEAARAGEAGRGFSVVASEVKSLAAQTAKATGDIALQVTAIQETTDKVIGAMKSIASTMNEIDGFTSAIAVAVEEQGSATQEISGNVQMAARGTEELAHNVTGVTGAIRETSRSAENVLTASGKLSLHANSLKDEVDHFLKEVAAA